jgi:hypothetical protein
LIPDDFGGGGTEGGINPSTERLNSNWIKFLFRDFKCVLTKLYRCLKKCCNASEKD